MSENTEMKKVPLEVPFAAEETKPYIFISYAHDDKDKVFPIIKRIYEKGWHVWYDQGIEINTNYHNVIADHVLGCAIVVLFVSRTSVTRDYVTDTEVGFALENKKRVIFCTLDEDAELPSGIRSRTYDSELHPRTTPEGILGVLEGIEGLTNVGEREAHGVEIGGTVEPPQIKPDDEYEFDTIAGGVRLTKYKGNAEHVVIPAKWKGRPVVELERTFCENETIKSVTIPDSVTTIGLWAFDCCSSLTSVTIPDSVTDIVGGWAFDGCPNLTIECEENSYAQQYAKKKKIPVRIVTLEKREKPKKRKASDNIPFVSDEETPFVYCSYAHENADIVYPIMKRLHDDGFSIRYDELDGKNSYVCSREIVSCAYFLAFLTPEYTEGEWLDELRLASPEKRILYWLKSCGLPQDLRLQQGCIQVLTSEDRTYEDIITTIENQLIKGNCRGHYTPTIPGFDHKADDTGITLVEYTGQDEVVVIEPEYHGRPVISIGDSAFSFCDSLAIVTIPDSVTIIGNMAFEGCSSLIYVTIPDSVTDIGDDAFSGCSSLTSVTIPDSVTSIGNSAFSGCSSLTSINVDNNNNNYKSVNGVLFSKDGKKLIAYPGGIEGCYSIPDSVTSIGGGAFSYCRSLTSVTIPDSVTDIGDDAFSGCHSLTSVTIPDRVTSIGDWAFSYCSSLTSVTIPSSVISIGNWAFSDCSSLTAINVDDNNKKYRSVNGVLFSKDGKKLIAYPGGIEGGYSIPNSVSSIGNCAFFHCSSLTSVIIPDRVTSIGDSAFSVCRSLTSVTIPNSVTEIGEGAFSKCSSLTSVTIPDSVTTIGGWAFDGCKNLTILCPENSYAWQYCEENDIPHKPLEETATATAEGTAQPLAKAAAAPETAPEITAKPTVEAVTESPAPAKTKNHRWLIPFIVALVLLAGGAAVQLLGIFDILGWLVGLLG